MKKLFFLILPAALFFSPLLWRGAGAEASAQQLHWAMQLGATDTIPLFDLESGGQLPIGHWNDIKQTGDSGYIVLGSEQDINYVPGQVASTGPARITLAKLDKSGALQWNKYVGLWDEIPGREVQPTADGGYIICGGYANVTKTDSAGNIKWANAYAFEKRGVFGVPPTEGGSLNSIHPTEDGGYIAVGYTSNFGQKGNNTKLGGYASDIYLVKLNATGVVEWAKTYGNYLLFEQGYYVRQTKDKGYIIAGQNKQLPYYPAEPNLPEEHSGFLLKTDSAGALKWSKYYGGRSPSYTSGITGLGKLSGQLYSVEETPDGGYIATGVLGFDDDDIDSFGSASVFKTDSIGNIKWNKKYDSGGNTRAYPTADGGFVMLALGGVGITQGPRLYKLDVAGNIEWDRVYGGDASSGAGALVVTKDHGYAMIGYGSNSDTTAYQTVSNYVIKTDSLGKNDACQNTKTGAYTVPTIATGDFTLKIGTASFTVTQPYTAATYPLSYSFVCPRNTITAIFYINDKSTSVTLVCDKDSASFSNASLNGEVYQWDFGDPASGINNTSTLKNPPKHKYPAIGTYTVTLIAGDSTDNIPSDTARKVVQVVSSKFVSVGSDVTICSGDSTLLIASGTFEYPSWSPTDNLREFFNDTTYAYPDTTTQYTAFAGNGGCIDSDSLIVTVIPKPIPIVNGNTTICQGRTTTLSAVGYTDYLWSTGETTASITIAPSVNTTYSITTYDGTCMGTNTIPITVSPSYTVNAGADVTIINGTGIVLAVATNAAIVLWLPVGGLDCSSCPNTTASPAVTTTYYIITETIPGSGCADMDTVTVYVINCGAIFVPSAFSPNNDGANDVLYLKSDCIKELDFKIYDRWGNRVFQSANVNEGWDGTYSSAWLTTGSGKEMDAAVFVYYVNAVLFSGETISRKGNISLVR